MKIQTSFALLGALGLLSSACGDSSGDGGGGAATTTTTSTTKTGASTQASTGTTMTDAKGIKVQISGEDFGPEGFPFPQGAAEAALADGWEVKFDHVLVSFGNIRVSENPDKVPSDQSQTDEVVAEVTQPYLVDLAVEGTETGAGGEGKAVLVTTIENQNLKGGAAFEGDRRYAFGYESLVPTAASQKLNLDPSADPHVATMIANGYSVMYVGTARFKGTQCTSSDDAYFATFPTEVPFALGFATPSSFLNCQNEENQGEPFDGEEYQRGVQIKTTGEALAQLTIHLDHVFYSDVDHEPVLYFDQLAAGLVGKPANTVLTMQDLVGIDPTAFEDASGAALPWRRCDGEPLPAGAQRGFEVHSVPVNPGAAPDQALRDYRDFVHYVQSTQGHLNGGEGICFVKRNYPSPP